jgi:hypothetical protein
MGQLARSLPPAWDGAKVTALATGPDGQVFGKMLPWSWSLSGPRSALPSASPVRSRTSISGRISLNRRGAGSVMVRPVGTSSMRSGARCVSSTAWRCLAGGFCLRALSRPITASLPHGPAVRVTTGTSLNHPSPPSRSSGTAYFGRRASRGRAPIPTSPVARLITAPASEAGRWAPSARRVGTRSTC